MGIGGFGFAPPTGGGVGLGLLPAGGAGAGFVPTTLEGREFESSEADTFFFHGAAVPFAAVIPGNTATGLALGLATLAVGVTGFGAATLRGGSVGADGAAA